ncbi:MAG TPA: hemolysin III family protein [Caulobacteraceae bacterium]|jgi:hemolysin III
MVRQIPDEYLVGHYPNAVERAVDGWIHVVAIALAGGGAAWLVREALTTHKLGIVAAAALYGVALICMLAFSAVYNLSHPSPARPFLRRLDEAGIFLMIAGSYTPFTTQRLQGLWAVGMTALVWAIAVAGIVGKLAFPKVPERAWTIIYLAFGWIALLAFGPLSRNLSLAVLALLVVGGVIYSAGSVLFHMRRLPFRRAVWHGFVCAGAGVHFWAIAAGVVLTPALSVAHSH